MADRTSSISAWRGPGAPAPGRQRLIARVLALIIPPRGQSFLPTATGYVLIVTTVGICIAAYSTGSNILFISVSLILSGLLLSGALSWVNFSRVCWRIQAEPPFREGEKGAVLIDLRNGKKIIPTYSLWFRISARKSRQPGRVFLEHRLDPGSSAVLEWIFEPAGRGVETITLSSGISEYPFGFLRKSVGRAVSHQVVVWPRRIGYEMQASGQAAQFSLIGNSSRRIGQGDDLINLRDYRRGDSQRLIHWKASAKAQRLQVRQFAAENLSTYFFFLQTSQRIWRDTEQFERMCRFAMTLAEDFYQWNRILGAAINDLPVIHIKRYVDIAYFFDQLAMIEMTPTDQIPATPLESNIVTFEPYGRSGVIACAAGQKIATA